MSRIDEAKKIKPEDVKANWKEIFERYTHLVGRNGKYVGLCPYHKESSGSFTVFEGGSYKCFGCGKGGGDVIQFLMDKENLTFPEALQFAQTDFNISKTVAVKKRILKEDSLIEIQKISFELRHKEYWNRYLLPEDYLNSKNVFAIDRYAVNKRVYRIKEDVAAFAYYAEDIGKYKILQIGGERKWTNWVPNDYIWGLSKIKDCKQLWVLKSLKDSLVMEYHFGFCTCALQNEDASIFLGNLDKVKAVCENVVIGLGSDPQGKAESIKITEATGFKWFNTPNYLYNYEIEDPSDWVDEFGVEPLRQLLIKKSYL